MKELSIEEKAKAYDEALETARKINSGEGVAAPSDWSVCEVIFPELRESEDERISKEIIKYLEQTVPHHHHDEVLKSKEWIAWLEKQGEQKKSYDTCDSSMMDNKKSPYGEKRDFGYFEEKPADKVEPKFKAGDWVVYDKNRIGVIVRLLSEHYIISFDGREEQISFAWEQNIRKWTIQDAKDGDVLAIDPWSDYPSSFVAIYKKQNGEDFDSYCFVGFDGRFYKGENGHSTEKIHPATKEQRDTLFAKMKKSSYKWLEETKELKKIEQKSSAWSEEDECYMSECIGAIATKDGWSFEEKRKTKHWLKALKDRYTWKPSYEQLKAIKWIMDGDNPENWTVTLTNLYNDLKKLSE